MLLFTGIFILTSPTLCGEYSEFAQDILVSFVQHFSQIYGPEMLVYNVHNLVHLAEYARKYGPLDNFSAFPFENYLFSMRKMVRKPQATQQVVRRMAETCHNRNQQLANLYDRTHSNGPLPIHVSSDECVQYSSTHIAGFFINFSEGNHCIMTGSSVMVVCNIVLCIQGFQNIRGSRTISSV